MREYVSGRSSQVDAASGVPDEEKKQREAKEELAGGRLAAEIASSVALSDFVIFVVKPESHCKLSHRIRLCES